MSSLANLSCKHSTSISTTASFVSTIQPASTKPVVYLTHDDLQKRTASLYTWFVSGYIGFLGTLAFVYAFLAVSSRTVLIGESGGCQTMFLGDVGSGLLLNVAGCIFLVQRFLMFQKEKLTDNLTVLKSPRQVASWLAGLFFVFLCLAHFSKSSCGAPLFWRISLLFVLQLAQVFGMSLANFLYLFKICREFEISVALDEEGQTSKKREDQFNGSFALNLSKFSKSNKDRLKYRRRARARPAEPCQIELETSIKDLDNLEVIKQSPEQLKGSRSAMGCDPTKRLSAQFRTIDVNQTADN